MRRYFGRVKVPLYQRFWSRVRITDTCWIWIGAKHPHGYGCIHVPPDNRMRRAHHVAYEMFNGPINGYYVLHICDNTSCVNPDHLFLGTQATNLKDMQRKRRRFLP